MKNIMLNQHINEAFRPEDLIEPLRALLARNWNKNSQNGLALSDKDIASLEDARISAAALVNSYFDRIVDTASTRRRNLEKFANCRFVSVGEDCFSRTILTRWGFKPPSKLGEKSGPFDLAIHPLASIIKLIRTDFENYLNIDDLIFDEQRKVASNSHYNVLFNHEVGPEWGADNFSKLRATYERRIENFSSLLTASGPTFFVLHIRYPAANQLRLIFDLAEELLIRCDSERKLICIATWGHCAVVDTQGRDSLMDRGIHFIDVNYPFEKYVWYNEVHASSEAGYKFELEISSKIEKFVQSSLTK